MPPLSNYVTGMPDFGPQFPWGNATTTAQREMYIRRKSHTSYHPCCTMRMGVEGDAQAVTNAQGQVFGVDNLRVVWLQQWFIGLLDFVDFSVLAAVLRCGSDLRKPFELPPPNRLRPMRLSVNVGTPFTIVLPVLLPVDPTTIGLPVPLQVDTTATGQQPTAESRSLSG